MWTGSGRPGEETLVSDTALEQVDFEVDRRCLETTRVVRREVPELGEGQVRFRVDRFALTANNITYAMTGDQLDYWGFFPAAEGWGRIPAMGWAEVVESDHADIELGERYFGWFPMSTFLVVDAKPTSTGLVDQAPHRARHAVIYRTYSVASRDPFYDAEREDRHALLRALFLTSFLAEDFFFTHDFFGARTSVVLSASSKTGIGFAVQAKARGRGPVIGVTSRRNVPFVERLGTYDQVVSYDDLDEIEAPGDAVLVDFSGNGAVVRRVHELLGTRLRHSMAIGASHGRAERSMDLPGPEQTFFFAPTQAAKRLADWGPVGYAERVGRALAGFVEGSTRWLEVERFHGGDAVDAIYQQLLQGGVPPHLGKIASMHAASMHDASS